VDTLTADSQSSAGPPALKKFRFLASKLRTAEALTKATPDSISSDLSKYVQEVEGGINCIGTQGALDFWEQRKSLYPRLAPVAQDFISAPASEAYVERIFSVAGMLSSGRRNKMRQSLEMRVFLKLNNKFVI